MTKENKQQQPPHILENKPDLSLTVLERIEKERLEPVPRWLIMCGEYAIWGLWGTSVLFGAVAISVMLYVSMHAGFAMYEATHDTRLSFFVDVLPFLWILVFIVMALIAYFNLRKTKKGYKYPFWQIVLSSLVCSVVGGGILHAGGIGYLIDTQIGKDMPMFPSLARTEEGMWQSPSKGRILGNVTSETEDAKELIFTDMDGDKWIFNISELMSRDIVLLQSGKRVRVIGVVSSTSEMYFHGCAVFPWMFDAPVMYQNLAKERRGFEEHVEQHIKRFIDKAKFDKIPPTDTVVTVVQKQMVADDMGLCPTLPLVKRLMPQSAR